MKINNAQILRIQGKTIQTAVVRRHEASDGCYFTTMEFRFTDGSSYEINLKPRMDLRGIFFRNENDEVAKEVQLIPL